MKKSVIIFAIVALIAGVGSSCGLIAKKRHQQAIETIREFYTLLVIEMNNEQPDMQNIEAIMNQYVTAEYQEKLRFSDLNYEFFVQGRHFKIEWLETLKITPHDSQKNAYEVLWQCTEETNCYYTLYLVRNENGKYMINDIEWRYKYDDVGDDDDWHSSNYYRDTIPRFFISEEQERLNAELMKLTECEGMSKEYDDLRTAMLFSSNFMDLTTFPFISGEFFSRMKYNGFEEFDEEFFDPIEGEGKQPFRHLLSFAYYQKGTDLAGLDKLLRRYGKLIQLIIPRKVYVANYWDMFVIQLLTAYDDLSAHPGNFRKLYIVMTENDWYSSVDAYDEVLPFVCDKQLKVFVNDRDVDHYEIYFTEKGKINKWCVVWAYSFWARRYNENPKNVQHIAAALKVLRDELYAPNAKPPKADKNTPPIEPYLTSKIRPGEKIYPWKLYTDRVRFLEYGDDEYGYVVEKDGERYWFSSNIDDDIVLNCGDMIDLTWNMGITYDYEGDGYFERIRFSEWAHSIKVVGASATTRFINKYGGIPNILCGDEDAIDEATKSKITNKLLEYMLESKEPKIVEALKAFGKTLEKIRIGIFNCGNWKTPNMGTLYGYSVDIALPSGEFHVSNDGEKKDIYSIIVCFIYNPNTDTLYVDVDGAVIE